MSGGLRIVRLANFVAPSSGGLRTTLRRPTSRAATTVVPSVPSVRRRSRQRGAT